MPDKFKRTFRAYLFMIAKELKGPFKKEEHHLSMERVHLMDSHIHLR